MSKIILVIMIIAITLQNKIEKECLTTKIFENTHKADLGNKKISDLLKPLKPYQTESKGKFFQIRFGKMAKISLEVINAEIINGEIEDTEILFDLNYLKSLQNLKSVPILYGCAYRYYRSNDKDKIEIFLFMEYLELLESWDNLEIADNSVREGLNNRKMALINDPDFFVNMFRVLKPLHFINFIHNNITLNKIAITNSGLKLINYGSSGQTGYISILTKDCHEFFKNKNYNPENPNSELEKNKPIFDIYSLALSISEFFSKSGSICDSYYAINCNNSDDDTDLQCFAEIFKSSQKIMIEKFGTPKKDKYEIGDCKDYGCVVLSCVQFFEKDMPSLKQVEERLEFVRGRQKRVLVGYKEDGGILI